MAKYQIFKAKDGNFYFRLRADNGQIILASQGYVNKQNAILGIKSVQIHCKYDIYYDRKNAQNGQYYFVLKSANHQVIGVSEMYVSAYNRDCGIESVKVNGSTLQVEEI